MKQLTADFGFGGTGLTDVLPDVIRGLLSPNVVVVDGAAANTDIAVAGMVAASHIISCVQFAAGVPSVVVAAVQADGKMQVTTDTTGDKLVVTFIP